jgi:hypothetical protein
MCSPDGSTLQQDTGKPLNTKDKILQAALQYAGLNPQSVYDKGCMHSLQKCTDTK